jgi:hypothetical protein
MATTPKRSILTAVGMALLLGLGAWPAAAGVITLNPVGDAFVSAANPLYNYGGAGALSVAAGGLAKGEFQGYMKFDTSSAKRSFDSLFGVGLWQIESVTLQLTAGSPNNPIFNSPSAAGAFSLAWIPDDSWIEGTGNPSSPAFTGVTYNAPPSWAGEVGLGLFNYGGATSGQTIYSLSLASAFASDVSAGNLVSLHFAAADTGLSYVFNSGNNSTVANRPLMSITAVTPEPASLALLAAGTLVLVRRKRSPRS